MRNSPAIRELPQSLNRLAAEVAAFPLATETSFHWARNTLDASKAARLWQDAEQHLLQRFGVSVDELNILRDQQWYGHLQFPNTPQHQGVSMLEYLRCIAEGYLRRQGNTASPFDPRSWQPNEQNGPDSRDRWRWMARTIPTDLLLVSLWNSNHRPIDVDLCPPQLAQRLRDDGFTEPHLHMGAGYDFSVYWSMLMASLSVRTTKINFQSTSTSFQHGSILANWLLIAGTSRLLLAEFLVQRSRYSSTQLEFASYFQFRVLSQRNRIGASHAMLLRDTVRWLSVGRLGSTASLGQLQAVLLSLCYVRPTLFKNLGRDPLDQWFPVGQQDRLLSESLFYCAAFEYFDSDGSNDTAFAQIFWQYIRIRNVHFSDIALGPQTPGLTAFGRNHARLATANSFLGIGKIASHCSYASGVGKGLRYLELRTAPLSKAHPMGKAIRAIEKALKPNLSSMPSKDRLSEWGMILHFQRRKAEGNDLRNTEPWQRNIHGNPGYRYNMSGFRFEYFYRRICAQAAAILELMKMHPSILARLRGIDLCTDERSVPYWVFVRVFERLREASDTACANYFAMHGESLQPLRCTIHVGEDFPHLLSGLRAIGLLLDYMPMRDGDRLGHALALGLDVSRWCQRQGSVVMYKEDRLFDLVWEWDCYSRSVTSASSSRAIYLSSQIRELSSEIFKVAYEPNELKELIIELHKPAALQRTGFPNVPRKSNTIIHRYLLDSAAFKRGRETVHVDTAHDAESCEQIQLWLRKRVAERGLAVEINPTSNLLIGQFGDLKNHPMWRIRNPNRIVGQPTIPIVIGSDDPITFSTRLPDEYAMLFDGMVSSGLNADEALMWLDDARRYGNDYRFTTANWLTGPSRS